MNESQYVSDTPRTNDPLANVLADMSAKLEKLEGIARLERKLEEVTTNFHGELDYLKAELSNLSEARNRDGAELNRLQTSIKGVTNGLQKNEEIQGNIEKKVDRIDNVTNKNLERIDRLERNTTKLSENLRLLEERDKEKLLGARQRVPALPRGTSDNSSKNRNSFSYSDQLEKGFEGLKSHNLLKELRNSETRERRKDDLGDSRQGLSREDSSNIDLFKEARKCIGLHPVKARHILDFNEGDYDICPDDISQHPDLRLLAAKEFLSHELKWKEDTEMRTKWSQDRNILWVSFTSESFVSSIFKRQAELARPDIRLLKYIPAWCYDRNKELEILCRLERDKDPDLRTKITLGHRDLKLNVKKKGDTFYKRVPIEHFGRLPGFNFLKISELSPGSPAGRKNHPDEEVPPQPSRKRTARSDSSSPSKPDPMKPRLNDISHDDDAWNGFPDKQ